MSALSELIDKYGIDAIKEALAKETAESAEKEAFNAPSLKVGNTKVSPEDFGQAVSAGSPPPPNFTLQGAPRTEIPQMPGNSSLPPPSGNVPSIPPQAGPNNLNGPSGNFPAPPPDTGGTFNQAPPIGGVPATIPNASRDVSEMQPSIWDTLKMPAAAGAAAMGGGAALMSTPQDKQMAPLSIADIRKNDDSIPTQDESDPDDEEDSDEDDSISKTPRTVQPQKTSSSSEAPGKSKTQQLADIMQAQDKSQGSLADAMHQRDLVTLGNQLGEAGNIIGGSIARVGPNAAASKAFEQNVALAQGIPKDFQAKQAAESEDPNSAMSKNYRDFLSRYGVKVGPGVTAQQIKDTLLPSAQKEQDLQEKMQGQKDSKALGMAQINAYRGMQQQAKLDKDTTNRIDKAGKMLDGELASSRSAFGRAANTQSSAEKIETMVAGLDPNDLNTRQITEIARNLDGMLSNGQPSISGMNKLIPKSASGDVSKIAEYISNLPKGAEQGAFVQNMLQTVTREKQLAMDQMARTQGKILGPYNDLKDKPVFQEMLRMKGIPSDVFSPNRQQKQIGQAPAAPQQDPKIAKWASDNNLTYDKAAAIIQSRQQGQ